MRWAQRIAPLVVFVVYAIAVDNPLSIVFAALLTPLLWVPILISFGLHKRSGATRWRRIFDTLWCVLMGAFVLLFGVWLLQHGAAESGLPWSQINIALLYVVNLSFVALSVVAIIWQVMRTADGSAKR